MRVQALLFLLLPLSAASSAAQSLEVGVVTDSHPQTQGQRPAQASEPLETKDTVYLNMNVKTNRKAWAQIAIRPIEPSKRGMVRIGPGTELVFDDFVVRTARGEKPKLSLRLVLGAIRIAFRLEGAEPGEGEYWINTAPGVEPIRLLGTDVYVKVDRDGGTTVVVVEGSVEIGSPGEEPVKVSAGEWTRIEPGRSPTPPAPIPTPDEPPGFPPDFPDGLLPPDPPNLILRLDLPR